MATTRIIPMHINKGKTIAQCMKARIDYVKNPDKTENPISDVTTISKIAYLARIANSTVVVKIRAEINPNF